MLVAVVAEAWAVQAAPMAAADDMSDPLVLEHMMGFNGDCKGYVQFHPVDPSIMISYTGCLLVISDVTDPHQQEFLRGHNEAISALAISASGQMLATGQTSTTRVPNSEAMVIVWDYKSRMPVYRLMELHDGIAFSRNSVQMLAFSPDDRFLAGSDDQPGGAKLCVWQMDTGMLATMARVGQRMGGAARARACNLKESDGHSQASQDAAMLDVGEDVDSD